MTLVSTGLQAIFESNLDDFEGRVKTLEDAVAALGSGSLGEELRAAAECDAHELVGSLGTFGLPRGSELAREFEQRFAPGRPADPAGDPQLPARIRALRRELDGAVAPDGDLETDDGQEPPRAGLEAGLAEPEPPALQAAGRILVVDDDSSVRHALSCILTEAGYDVRDVGSAREARHVLEHDTIAMLLSDVSMPGDTGLDLIRFALSEYPQTATLLISALEDPGIAQVALDSGAYGYLSKPIRRSAVLIGVMNALRRREMETRERAMREELEQTVKDHTDALSHALHRLEGAAEQGGVLHAETIHRWARAAEYRDPGSGRHVKRVSRYCAVLGQRFGLHAESLELASVLHDVGLIAIPERILLKPAPLTVDERLALETHADIGHGMLSGSGSSVLDLAASIASTHHEKFDGSGYPRGLTGADIPLEGRLAAVADVFDALTCDRVYRPAWSVETTVAWMKGERGKHFDPHVFDAFLLSLDDVLEVRIDLAIV